jgi:hypothetical protein
LEIGKPTDERFSWDSEHAAQFVGTGSLGPFLPNCHNYQNNAPPIDPSPQEKTRWGKAPPAAFLAATTQTLPDEKLLRDGLGTASGFASIVGLMQRTAAMRTTHQPLRCSQVLVDEMKQLKKADFLNKF